MKQTRFMVRLRTLQGDIPTEPFAHKLGISHSYLSRLYRGERKPRFKLIRGALRAFPDVPLVEWGLREID